jgi:predicted ATP-dependent endonuclease of OLD family
MHLHHCHIKNFRRLKNAHLDLEKNISIFVGTNNSGKTSAAHAVQMFASGSTFGIHDFNTDCWKQFDEIGSATTDVNEVDIPRISLDLWFTVDTSDLHRVIELLPRLDWSGSLVGIRIEFCAKDGQELLRRFRESQEESKAKARTRNTENGALRSWPTSLTDYLRKRMEQEFELRYFVLDQAQFDSAFDQKHGYEPRRILSDRGRGGAHVLNGILRVDCLNAQRHLSDGEANARAEDLSRRMSKFYRRNLEQCGDDYAALQALADSEAHLNAHFADVFQPTLKKLEELGYPGLDNPRLLIRSALNPETVLGSAGGARVHYQVGKASDTLPERYNGLGFKNLIYIVIELLDLHARWLTDEQDQAPLHLIFIEEPEAHLHVQLQQVFIRKVLDILAIGDDAAAICSSQVVVTTHSPHILHERGFQPIRYFRRSTAETSQESQVLNVSRFFTESEDDRGFLERYMRLAHCDLFFADAAILVEGNVERLLMPLMIEKSANRLRGAYVSILEVGGAFGYRFRRLLEFLGVTTLIVTDIDSVQGTANEAPNEDSPEAEEGEERTPRCACPVGTPGAVTSNQTLIQWLPRKSAIGELLAASVVEKTSSAGDNRAKFRVAYQTEYDVTWGDATERRAGRTGPPPIA